jgi:hypothetical protein
LARDTTDPHGDDNVRKQAGPFTLGDSVAETWLLCLLTMKLLFLFSSSLALHNAFTFFWQLLNFFRLIFQLFTTHSEVANGF